MSCLFLHLLISSVDSSVYILPGSPHSIATSAKGIKLLQHLSTKESILKPVIRHICLLSNISLMEFIHLSAGLITLNDFPIFILVFLP